MTTKRFDLTGGLYTAAAGQTPDGYAQALQDVRIDDAVVRPRYGFHLFHTAPGGFTAVHGFERVRGYDSSYNPIEYWLGVATTALGTHPYIWKTDATIVQLGVFGDPSFNASPWVIRHFDSVAYLINKLDANAPYSHDLGVTTAPVSLPYAASPGTVIISGVGLPGWGAILPTIGTRTGKSAVPTVAGDFNSGNLTEFISGHNAGIGVAGFTMDITGLALADRDFSYLDTVRIKIENNIGGPLRIDPNSLTVELENSAAVKFSPTAYWSVAPDTNGSFTIECYFDAKARASYADISKIKIDYKVTISSGVAAERDVIFSVRKFYPDTAKDVPLTAENMIEYGVTLTSGAKESDMSRVNVPASYQSSLRTLANGSGHSVFLYIPVVLADYKIYMRCSDGAFHVIKSGTTNATPSPIEIYYTDSDGINAAIYGGPPLVSGAVSACAYKGRMVWFYRGGKGNIRHARIGDAEKLASAYDDDADEARGATFTMADGFDDEPLGGVQVGGVLVVLGSEGVYAQAGDTPAAMTPTRKLQGPPGCAGRFAFATFKSDSGEPGCAYLDKHGEHVWFVGASQIYQSDSGGKPVQLTEAIPSEARKWLSEIPVKTLDLAQVRVDEATGDLWVTNYNRALVFTQGRDGSGERYWLRHHFSLDGAGTPGWAYWSFGPRRLWAVRNNGSTNEFFWNSSTNQYIEGLNRDAGFPLINPYYEIGFVDHSQVSRIEYVGVQRLDPTDGASVSITTDRGGTVPVALASNVRTVRGPRSAQGHRYSVRVTVPEAMDGIDAIEVTTSRLSAGFRHV